MIQKRNSNLRHLIKTFVYCQKFSLFPVSVCDVRTDTRTADPKDLLTVSKYISYHYFWVLFCLVKDWKAEPTFTVWIPRASTLSHGLSLHRMTCISHRSKEMRVIVRFVTHIYNIIRICVNLWRYTIKIVQKRQLFPRLLIWYYW